MLYAIVALRAATVICQHPARNSTPGGTPPGVDNAFDVGVDAAVPWRASKVVGQYLANWPLSVAT